MVKNVAHWFLIAVLFLWACDNGPPNTPRITVPVTDSVGVLSSAQREGLATQLVAHREATHVQIAFLVVETTNGEPIEDFSHRVATRWSGGQRGRDNGVLVTFAIRDRRSRIEVGRGLEELLPDARTRTLLDRARPQLRSRDYGQAFQVVLDGLIHDTSGARLEAAPALVSPPDAAAPTAPVVERTDPAGIILGSGIAAAVFALVFGIRRADRRREEEAAAQARELEEEQNQAAYKKRQLEHAERTKAWAAECAVRDEEARKEREVEFRAAEERVRAAKELRAKLEAEGTCADATPEAKARWEAVLTKERQEAEARAAARVAQIEYERRMEARRRAEAEEASKRAAAQAEARRKRERSYSSSSYRSSNDSPGWSGYDSSSSSSSSSDYGGGGGGFDGGGSSSDW